MSDESKEIKLTQMVKSAGCAAKLFPFILSEALKDINWKTDKNVLVGLSGKDDAGIYRINDDLALIQTTDFFTPVVDDPYTFGQIAAVNSLSDVYAMGGVPVTALNIVAFPQDQDIEILKEIFRGGVDKANEAGCFIIGGHSIDIPNIVYGLSVTGKIHPENIKGNNSCKPGDVLILTKGLGTGVLNNSIKYGKSKKHFYDCLVSSMTRLNKTASENMIRHKANGCTDVTGFGLAGHSMQMAQASKVVLNFEVNKLPFLEGAEWAVGERLLTRCDKSNRIYTQEFLNSEGKIDIIKEHLIFDPQTSGGLLISVPEINADSLLNDLRNSGDKISEIVGYVTSPGKKYKEGTIVFDYTN